MSFTLPRVPGRALIAREMENQVKEM